MDTEQQLKEDIHTLIERYRKEEGGDGVVLLNIYSAIKSNLTIMLIVYRCNWITWNEERC